MLNKQWHWVHCFPPGVSWGKLKQLLDHLLFLPSSEESAVNGVIKQSYQLNSFFRNCESSQRWEIRSHSHASAQKCEISFGQINSPTHWQTAFSLISDFDITICGSHSPLLPLSSRKKSSYYCQFGLEVINILRGRAGTNLTNGADDTFFFTKDYLEEVFDSL